MATRMQQRRGLSTQWAEFDPVLRPGEFGWESDTNNVKIGDGVKPWSELPYFNATNIDLSLYATEEYVDDAIEGIGAALPTQTDNAGKYLTTDGTAASWAEVDTFPTQTDNEGKFLTTDGTDVSWAAVDALPDQTGNSGKFLTTDGTAATWSGLDDYATVEYVDSAVADIPPGTVVSDTAPLTAEDNALWWNSSNATLYIYYDNAWVQAVAGVTGPQGLQGIQGPAGPTGASGLEWKGTWDDETAYLENDAVFYNNSSWFASSNITAGEIPSNASTLWFPLALQGATGPTGPQGPKGDKGDPGGLAQLDDYATKVYVDDAIDAIDALPDQATNAGKYLTTDGTATSWAEIDLDSKQDKVANVTDTEIGYLDGVTSAIQTQLDDKADLDSPAFTGDVDFSDATSVDLSTVTITRTPSKAGSSTQPLGTITSNGGTPATLTSFTLPEAGSYLVSLNARVNAPIDTLGVGQYRVTGRTSAGLYPITLLSGNMPTIEGIAVQLRANRTYMLTASLELTGATFANYGWVTTAGLSPLGNYGGSMATNGTSPRSPSNAYVLITPTVDTNVSLFLHFFEGAVGTNREWGEVSIMELPSDTYWTSQRQPVVEIRNSTNTTVIGNPVRMSNMLDSTVSSTQIITVQNQTTYNITGRDASLRSVTFPSDANGRTSVAWTKLFL